MGASVSVCRNDPLRAACRECEAVGPAGSNSANQFSWEDVLMVSRRKFLRDASAVGAAIGAQSLLGTPLFGQARNATDPVRIYIDSRRIVAPLDRNLFGSFLEHLGRAIYEGIYDPGSKLSDANGFRKDVVGRNPPDGRAHHPLSGRKLCFWL